VRTAAPRDVVARITSVDDGVVSFYSARSRRVCVVVVVVVVVVVARHVVVGACGLDAFVRSRSRGTCACAAV
jgi:hypothetical protein